MSHPDYSEFTAPLQAAGPGDNVLKALSQLAQDVVAQEAEVARLDEALKRAKARLQALTERELPELARTAGQDDFKTSDGLRVRIKEIVRASVSEESGRMPGAVAELERRGAGHLVKHHFVIEFGKDEEAWARKFQRDLEQRKKRVRVKRKDFVHTQTLAAYIKEELEHGAKVNLELFGAQQVRVAKVEVPS